MGVARPLMGTERASHQGGGDRMEISQEGL